MSKFIASWLEAAAAVLEAEFGAPVDLLPGAAIPAGAASFTLMVELAGDWAGSFTATVDEGALGALLGGISAGGAEREPAASSESLAPAEASAPLTIEAVREQWQRLFQRIAIAAAAALGAASGAACEVAMISAEDSPAGPPGMGYQLRTGEAMAALVVADLVERAETARPPSSAFGDLRSGAAPPPAAVEVTANEAVAAPAATGEAAANEGAADGTAATNRAVGSDAAIDQRGMDLLLDVELEASLRFGSREMTLCDLLALGPGDVIQLDRALTDPVDLIIGDKIVARGEVVLVNGNFGLEIAEVAEPRKSLESIRCLF
jgi:flagellar motor switch protein FliN